MTKHKDPATVVRVEVVRQLQRHRVDCAVREDGSSPANDFLTQLKSGMWEDDPDSTQIPDDEQLKDYDRLIHIIRYVAKHGEPERSTDLNYLRDGIWEFKVAAKRIAFYDTDGEGVWEPKGKIQVRADSPFPDSQFWWFPELDNELRLLNAWPKVSQRADPVDIDLAMDIAVEDVSRDEHQ